MNKEYMNNLVEFLKDVGMTASFVGKENGVPMDTLLAGLPGEVEEGHLVVCNPVELDGEEQGFTAYIQMYYEIPQDVSELDEADIYVLVNKMNSISLVGHFVYGDDEENRKRVYIRHTYTCDIEEEPNASVFCECLQRLLEYGAFMEEMLAGLSSGMGMEEILAAEQLGR